MDWFDGPIGGPRLLIERRLLPSWRGADANPGGATDFERACAVGDYAGLIPVGEGVAVVLGEEPMPTAIRRTHREGLLLVRWMYAPDDASVEGYIANLPELPFGRPRLSWHVADETQFVVEAVQAGPRLPAEHMPVGLVPGTYELSTHVYAPAADCCLVLHRLDRVA
jgi:Immunity protein 21